MSFLAGQARRGVDIESGQSFPPLVRIVVIVGHSHLTLKNASYKTGNGGVFFGGFQASPVSHFFR